MRILFLTFYYKPDLCAGSFRTSALIEQLNKKYGNDIDIEIITTMPNRYASFSSEAKAYEKIDCCTIHRIKLPNHKSGMIDQIISFSKFYREAKKITHKSNYNLVFATSSRLFTAFLGARISKRKNIPLYLDIRDIFVDTLKDVLNDNLFKSISIGLSWIERYTFSTANHINLVSKGFEKYFKERFPKPTYSFYSNGIDEEFLTIESKKSSQSKSTKGNKTILYAGNIGEGQGLHNILPKLALKFQKYNFIIIGDGGVKQKLLDVIEKDNKKNIILLPPMSRENLIKKYLDADVLFLHLNDFQAFEKVLPSKIFEYAAFDKPILAGVSGYARQFINENVENSFVFNPCDLESAEIAIKNINFSPTNRTQFIEKFARKKIMSEMSKNILEIGKS